MSFSSALAEVDAEPLLVDRVGSEDEVIVFLSLFKAEAGVYLREVALECRLVPIFHLHLDLHLLFPCTVASCNHVENILNQVRFEVVIELGVSD